jgi:hypothetical protein
VDSQRQLVDVSSLEPGEVPVSGDSVVNQPVAGERIEDIAGRVV